MYYPSYSFFGLLLSGIFTYLVSLTRDITQYWFCNISLFLNAHYSYLNLLIKKCYDDRFWAKEYLYNVKYKGMKDILNKREKLEKKFPNV